MGNRGFASVPSVLSNWSAVKHLQHQQAHLYEDVFNLLGATTTIVNLCDMATAPSATTFTTRPAASGSSQTATWATAPSLLATPFTQSERPTYLTAGLHGPAGIPGVIFGAVAAERINIPDAAYWTRALAAFSVIVCGVFQGTAALNFLFAKNGTVAEWDMHIDAAEDLTVRIWDNTNGGHIKLVSDASIPLDAPVVLGFTHDGAANMTGSVLYVNGASVAATASTSGVFTTMVNTTEQVSIAAAGDNTVPLKGTLYGGPYGPTFVQAQLTANAMLRYNWLFRGALGLD